MPTQFSKAAFWLGIIGAIKLLTDTMGYKVFEDSQVDALANGFAALFAILGVFFSHDKKPPDPEE